MTTATMQHDLNNVPRCSTLKLEPKILVISQQHHSRSKFMKTISKSPSTEAKVMSLHIV